MQQHLSLSQALRVSSSACIAFIGSGGKTTAMFQLARELPEPVIVTATSHLGLWQTRLANTHIITDSAAPLEELEHGMKGIILVTGEVEGERTKPIDADLLNWLHQFCGYHAIPLLIEADGARVKPLKGWAEHEPPIPAFAELVLQVIGLSGLGKPLTDEYVHRAQIFAALSKLKMGETITVDALNRVLTHPAGGSRNIPAGARKVALLNQADTPELQSAGRGLSLSLTSFYDSVVIASLQQDLIYAVYEPIAGVVLAAGESKRFGQTKQLLDWKGEPFVRVVSKTALQAGLSPVVVVIGSDAQGVESAVKDLNVIVVRNENWKSGQASSIRAATGWLTSGPTPVDRDTSESLARPRSTRSTSSSARDVGGAMFLLADQPQLTTSVIRALVETHARGLYPVVAPMVIDQRANPVLFDQVTFSDLMTLEGDVGGRAIFHKYRVEYLPWHDDRLLLDVDTPEMYQRLISDETL